MKRMTRAGLGGAGAVCLRRKTMRTPLAAGWHRVLHYWHCEPVLCDSWVIGETAYIVLTCRTCGEQRILDQHPVPCVGLVW